MITRVGRCAPGRRPRFTRGRHPHRRIRNRPRVVPTPCVHGQQRAAGASAGDSGRVTGPVVPIVGLQPGGWCRRPRRFRGGDVVLLTHRGRRSGRTFTTPLLHVRDGDDIVVAASNGGVDAEPQWWLNLQADPHGEVEVRGRRWAVVAAPVEDSDRMRLWQALMDRCPTYDDYQAKVSRRIALVRLSPA
jgi:F420H(2)-dependent quinone reductase